MNTLHVKYLLIGGGLASSAAAQAIRQADADGSLLLVGQEVNRPYHRPPLSKEYLRGGKQREELFTLEGNWFAEHHVQLRTGRRVAHLDTARSTAMLDSGEEISYDHALLATGASPAHLTIPGADLPNVHYLRTLDDAERLNNGIQKALFEGRLHDNGRGRATVVGGGVLGVELAASFTQLGLKVDLACGQSHPWRKFAGEAAGRFITQYLERKGVHVHSGQRAERLEGDGRAQRVVLSDGTVIDCDFVVAAVGMTVNKELLRGSPIAAEKAILANEYCRTNVTNIYAAGDCAAVFDPLFGKHRILDHWDNAIVTGTLAGGNMAGLNRKYDAVNYFFTDVFDLSVSIWGEAKGVDRSIVRGSTQLDDSNFIEFGIAADGSIAQVLAVNHPDEDAVLQQLVRRRVRIDGNEDHFRDPTRDLSGIVSGTA
jgi:3-phenylpropionate/trans-cinnamate dioxygenase ferredoxin reductase subunit